MDPQMDRALQNLRDSSRDTRERIDAARSLGACGDPEVRGPLREFLDRAHPPDKRYIDLDPRVAERLCDMAVVAALHELGDDPPISRLLSAINEASAGHGEPIKETEFAADTIRRIGSISVIGRLVEMAGASDHRTVPNAVKTLAELDLPEPATHQRVDRIAAFTREFAVKPRMLVAYFADVVRLSDGALALSPSAQSMLREDDYMIAEGEAEDTSVADVLKTDASLYGLAYFVDGDRATLCTFPEAGVRWQSWWREHADTLIYDKAKRRFVLREAGK